MRALLATLILFTITACEDPAGTPPPLPVIDDADKATVFIGGTIYTGRPEAPTADFVKVDAEGRIENVISGADAAEAALAHARENYANIIDLEGAVMFPGFVDAHAHLLGIGQRELRMDLSSVLSIDDLTTRIASELEDKEPGEVLFGTGWIETGWPERRMPSIEDLDPVSPDNPVILVRADGHALVANSAALEDAGIGFNTVDPQGGQIERSDDGQATGMLIDNAMTRVLALVSQPTEADIITALATGADVYARRGWTGLHNMSVDPEHAPLLERLYVEGRMPVRLHNAYDPSGFELVSRRRHETETIQNRSIKIYMDGALGSRGAQLVEPYADRPETSGLSLLEDDALLDQMNRAAEENVQLAIHAIGDLANKRVLDMIETQYPTTASALRWRIEHAQIIQPDDIARVAELQLIASMQPSHAIGDLFFAPDRLGPDRLDGAYAWNSLIEAGAIIAGGSDAPVEVGSPQIEFYAAVARRGLNGFQDEAWRPGEAVSRENALKMFTIWPAFASFQEEDLGTIAPGKLGDFTVFDRDLMTIPAEEILEARAVMTIVAGDIVFPAKGSE